MANIQDHLEKIKSAVYGKDVRQSIVDAIHQCYDDGKAANWQEELPQKLSLPKDDMGVVDYGEAGQFAVSDGNGGVKWVTIENGNEVAY